MAYDKILRMKHVIEQTGLCRATVYNRIKAGDFPRPIRLGPKAVGFLASELQAWIEDRAAARCAK